MRDAGAWASRDFRRLWAAEIVSQTGSQVSVLALPLIAILALGAGPVAVGVLAAAATAPVLLVGLPAGALVDRCRRRPILVACDVGRAAAIATVPLAWALGALTLGHLYVVAFACGLLTVCADVAAQSLLPGLVGTDRLASANAGLELARSGAQVAGPGLAGGLVAAVGAPLAVVADAASFVWSAVWVARTVDAGTPPARGPVGVRAGLRYVASHPLLRPLAACSAVSNLGSSMVGTVLVLFMVDDLRLGPAAIGAVLAVANVGLVLGAAVAGRLARRFGTGPVIVGALGLGSPFALLVPLAPARLAVPAVLVAQMAAGIRAPVYNVNQISLRQGVTPPELLGRMTATMRTLVLATMPVGALLGGAVAGLYGTRAALLAGAVVGCLAPVILLRSPVRSVTAPVAGW